MPLLLTTPQSVHKGKERQKVGGGIINRDWLPGRVNFQNFCWKLEKESCYLGREARTCWEAGGQPVVSESREGSGDGGWRAAVGGMA